MLCQIYMCATKDMVVGIFCLGEHSDGVSACVCFEQK